MFWFRFFISNRDFVFCNSFYGKFFLLLLAISVFYIVNHSIQVVFFNLKKEIEVLLILGATQGFIYTPFIFSGFLITFLGCLLGAILTYVIFLSVVALITFNESSFFCCKRFLANCNFCNCCFLESDF